MGCGRRCDVTYWPGEPLAWQLQVLAVFGRCAGFYVLSPRRHEHHNNSGLKLAMPVGCRCTNAYLADVLFGVGVAMRCVLACACESFGLSRCLSFAVF